MRYLIAHETPGRIRFDLRGKIPETDAVAFEELFSQLDSVKRADAYPKAGYLAITYRAATKQELRDARKRVIEKMDALSYSEIKQWEPADSVALAPRPRHLISSVATMLVLQLLRRILLPRPLRLVWTIVSAIPFWTLGLKSLMNKRLDVPVLDAAAITLGLLQGKPDTSSNIMLLLNADDALENYTHRRSESGLIRSLLTIPSKARRAFESGDERDVEIADLRIGDIIVVRLGEQVPVDGTVIRGAAAVNQSSLTGEPLAVTREVGDTVYAGTALEEGEIFVRVEDDPHASKLRNIITMVEQSESLKSSDQRHVEQMADALVPWNFLLAATVALVTRNLSKVSGALMVDYSCALRLTGSIAVMAAQRESAQHGFVVKGSRYFDHMAEADTIVFDKTGTLTTSAPEVESVVAYGGWSRDEALRLAACLEEHFPHPLARAVVNKAFEEGLEHREEHAGVEYIVAHGIVSSLRGKRVVLGSERFVIEQEQVAVTADELDEIHAHAAGMSPLFLSVDRRLRGVIYIKDPLKNNARRIIEELHEEGFEHVIMLTGDNRKSAERIARECGITEYRADLLPEDKYTIIQELQNAGRKVCMVGDGVNDSPALSVSHVSIAMKAGSSIAREAADIALLSDDLESLVELRKLSRMLDRRMRHGYNTAIAVNTLLIALGIIGAIKPTLGSLLHNGTTIALSALNTRRYLPKETKRVDIDHPIA